MKIIALALSGMFAALDPSGCSAGSNVANGPDASSSSSSSSSGGTAPTGVACSGSGGGGGGTHAFCEDFAATSLPASFDQQELFAGALKVDTSRALTSPNALIASTTQVTTGTRTYARLRKEFPTKTGTHFTLAYSEWVDSACINQGDNVETGVIGMRNNSYWVAIRHAKDSDSILETGIAQQSLTQAHVLRSSLRRDGWVRVQLDVDLAKKTIDLSADGARVVEAEPLKEPPSGSQSPLIAVGLLNDNLQKPPTACNVTIDDVTFDIE